MLKWNDCVLIYENGEFNENFDKSMMIPWMNYINTIGNEPDQRVWFDVKSKVCFGCEQDFYSQPNDFSFFSKKGKLQSNPKWGMQHVMNYLGTVFGTDVESTDEFIIQKNDELKKFEGKTILMIGGGPSTSDIDWSNCDIEYDYLWSCNNFFLNPKINELGCDLCALGPTVDLEDERLLNHLKENNTLALFEAGISPFRKQDEFTNFLSKHDNCSYFHLRYFSKVGTLARLICLANFLKVKKVYFVGMDGYPGADGDKYKHAFEGPTKEHQGRKFSYDLHKRQYVLLWDYLLNDLNSKVEFQNLGEGHEANQSTDISKKEFPLQINYKNGE